MPGLDAGLSAVRGGMPPPLASIILLRCTLKAVPRPYAYLAFDRWAYIDGAL